MCKITKRLLIFILVLSISLKAVDTDTTGFSFSGSIGLDFIRELIQGGDSTTLWFNIAFKPEISLSNFGIGLYVPLRISNHGKFKKTDWDSPSDWASVIRYVRYGKRGTPFWIKAGVLEQVTIANGFIMDDYRNTIDEDTRKTGVQVSSDIEKGGGELLISNLGNGEIIGGRGFIRPIKFISPIPILSNIEIGGTLVRDFESDTSISILGFDATLPIINTSFLGWKFYTHYAHIFDYGSGSGYGSRVDFNFLMKIITLSVKFERRNIGAEFIPSYFGPFYEVIRDTLPDILNKTEKTKGYYGGLYLTLLDKLELIGTYRWTDETESGILNLSLDITRLLPQMPISLSYTKRGITKSSELFDMSSNEDVVLSASLSPQILPHIYLMGNIDRRFMKDNDGYQPIDKYSIALGYQF